MSRLARIDCTSYVPHEKGILFHTDPSKHRLLRGGIGSGKTRAAAEELVGMAIRTANRAGAGALFGVFRKTGPALEDYTRPAIEDCLPAQLVVPGSRKITEGRGELTIVGGTRVIFRPLDEWRKLGGAEFDAEFVDEAKDLTDGDAEMLKGRLRGRRGPRRAVYMTQPPTRNHWLYKWFGEDTRQPTYADHHWSTLDNAANLPEDYLSELLAWEQTDPVRFKRFVLGDWGFTSDRAPVYPQFHEDHNQGKLEVVRGYGQVILTGWDFGWRRPAVLWAQILDNGWVNFLRELGGDATDLRNFVLRFKQQHALAFPHDIPVLHQCDVAGKARKDTGPTSVRVLREEGIHPRYRKLRVMRRVQLFRDLMARWHLGRPMLMADRRHCKMFVEGCLGGYHLDPETDEPEKDGFYDNYQDAGAYAVAPALLVPKEKPEEHTAVSSRPRVAV